MGAEPGTYALILRCDDPGLITIGRLGSLPIRTGYFVYVGSAFGPGGIRARVARHHAMDKPRHWHIDHLRPHARIIETWISFDPAHREHQWAELLSRQRGVNVLLEGFGASDCDCPAHLFHFVSPPRIATFRQQLVRRLPGHWPVKRALVPASW